MNNFNANIDLKRMSKKNFNQFSDFVYNICGINLTENKKTMLEARLQKRLKVLGFNSMSDYCDYFFSVEGQKNEFVTFIDIVTTNKTDFFREPEHFDYLVNAVLPELISTCGSGVNKIFNVWSAGCSTGEEPYTIAIVLEEFSKNFPGFNFNYMILGTDISTEVLESAKKAVYSLERVVEIPYELKKKYFLKGKNSKQSLVRIVPKIREKVNFRQLNFLTGDFGMREPMDIIFCRNVIIYFDKETQEKVLGRLCGYLKKGGYLFIGHSENIHGFSLPLQQMAPTIYKRI